jgi:hypothetical protein
MFSRLLNDARDESVLRFDETLEGSLMSAQVNVTDAAVGARGVLIDAVKLVGADCPSDADTSDDSGVPVSSAAVTRPAAPDASPGDGSFSANENVGANVADPAETFRSMNPRCALAPSDVPVTLVLTWILVLGA